MAHLGNKHEAEEYWKKTEPHLQARYCHISLGTKIEIESLHAPTHYSGKALKADKESIYGMSNITENEIKINDVHLMVYMTRGNVSVPLNRIEAIGFGKIKAVCAKDNHNTRYKQSISVWQKDTAAFGSVSQNISIHFSLVKIDNTTQFLSGKIFENFLLS